MFQSRAGETDTSRRVEGAMASLENPLSEQALFGGSLAKLSQEPLVP